MSDERDASLRLARAALADDLLLETGQTRRFAGREVGIRIAFGSTARSDDVRRHVGPFDIAFLSGTAAHGRLQRDF